MFDKFENWFEKLSDGRKLIVAFWLPFVLGVLLGLYPTVTIMCSKIEVLRERIDADLKEGLEQTSEHKADNEPAPAEDATPQGSGLHILNEPETVRRDAVNPDGIRSDIGVNLHPLAKRREDVTDGVLPGVSPQRPYRAPKPGCEGQGLTTTTA